MTCNKDCIHCEYGKIKVTGTYCSAKGDTTCNGGCENCHYSYIRGLKIECTYNANRYWETGIN